MKVLVTEKIADDGVQKLAEFAEVDVKLGLSQEEICGIIGGYDALVVRSATQVDARMLEKGKNLKVVGRAGTGVDNIDVDAATRLGIVVVNTPDGNSVAAAELTIGLIISIFRSIPQAYAAVKNNDFRRARFKGFELNNKVAGIIGLGRIGGLVAERLKGLNMRVIGYDPYIPSERFKKAGVERCETLEELLKKADLITIHIAKTDETVNMLGEKQFKLMKKGVRIVNCARGGIINEEALYNALEEGTVAAAGLDVLEEEPNFELKPEEQTYANKLLELDNVVYLPHLGASTQEAQYNVGIMAAEQVAGVLKGEMVSAVNMPGIQNGELDELKPYLNIAEFLGKIYFQAEKEPVEKIELIYSGDIAKKQTRIVTMAALKGFLQPVVSDRVNYVNAELIAKSRGIEVVESTSSELERFTSLITLKLHTKSRVQILSGTVFGVDAVRIVDFFGYKIDFEPTPFMLAVQNIDRPGIVGKLGTILGAADVNIASMQLSRNKRGEKAVAFLSIDGEVPQPVLDRIREVDGILKATMIKF